jgi:hypothetical protein
MPYRVTIPEARNPLISDPVSRQTFGVDVSGFKSTGGGIFVDLMTSPDFRGLF